MALRTNVVRRGAVYYHRIRVPKDLTTIIGRQELCRSLRTACPDEARRRGVCASSLAHITFDQVRRSPMLSKNDVSRIVRAYYERELELDAEGRRGSSPTPPWQAEIEVRTLTVLETTLSDHLARGEFVLVSDEARRIIADDHLAIIEGSPAYRELCQGLMRARIEATRRQLERTRGDWSGTASDPLLASPVLTLAAVGKTPNRSVPPMADVLATFFAEKKFSPKHEREFRDSIDWFQDYAGRHKKLSDFTQTDVVEYKAALQRLPSNFRKHFRGATVREAIEKNQTANRPVLSVASINNKRLGNLDTFFGWAEKNGYVEENPAAGIRVEIARGSKHKKKRDPFTIEQLNRIFASPTFVGCASSSRWKELGEYQIRDHRFWLPLLGLFTGGRQGELAQLLVTDVTEMNRVSVINITDEGDPDTDEDSGKSVKNAESRRAIPVHPTLKSLGFMKYVEAQRKAGHTRLFPECQRGADGSFSPFSKHFRRFLDSLGIKKRGRTVFHSFRHAHEDAMRSTGMPDTARFQLAGRTFNHSSEEYGTGYTPERLAEWVAKIEYAGLELAHLYLDASKAA